MLGSGRFPKVTAKKYQKIIRLRKTLEKILKKHPDADPHNVWHTLILLQKKPLERLEGALRRAQK